MTNVTVRAGASGVLHEIVFSPPEPSAGESAAHGDGAGRPSPYDYLLVALGA